MSEKPRSHCLGTAWAESWWATLAFSTQDSASMGRRSDLLKVSIKSVTTCFCRNCNRSLRYHNSDGGESVS